MSRTDYLMSFQSNRQSSWVALPLFARLPSHPVPIHTTSLSGVSIAPIPSRFGESHWALARRRFSSPMLGHNSTAAMQRRPDISYITGSGGDNAFEACAPSQMPSRFQYANSLSGSLNVAADPEVSVTIATPDTTTATIQNSKELQDLQRPSKASTTDSTELFWEKLQSPPCRCSYPDCKSEIVFTRACELRKHFRRHIKHLFCRFPSCAANENSDTRRRGGFSTKKDRSRHEAKHNPRIRCEWNGEGDERCRRVFSRADNMRDHIRRVHKGLRC